VCVVEISAITKLAPPRVLLHRFLPTALAGGQLLYGTRQSSGIASLIRLLGLEGIISTKLHAPYRSGPSKTRIKVKNPKASAATRAPLMVRFERTVLLAVAVYLLQPF
jgi:hypothetical protein